MRHDRQITLADVAEHAAVSPKTVSRVMNYEPNVREETRERVMASARTLGYRPNPAARSLAGSRSFLISHVHDNPNLDYVARANAGIYQAGREHGYYLLPEPIDSSAPDLIEHLEEFLVTSSVDSVILTPPLADDERVLSHLRMTGTPFVLISPAEPETAHAPFVSMDQRAAARDMTRYLISLGHTMLAFIAGPRSHLAALDRQSGFFDAIDEAGLDRAACRVVEADFTLKGGLEAAKQILSDGQRPTAVFGANDHIAAGVVTCALAQGLRVPEDLSVCGFDGTELGEAMWPPLTTIRNPIRDMTARAANFLMSSDKNRSETLGDTLTCELVVRGSTGPAPTLA